MGEALQGAIPKRITEAISLEIPGEISEPIPGRIYG